MSEEIARELGSISATLAHIKKTQEDQGKTLAGVDDRLRKVETRSAINGAVTGGVMAVAVAFIKDAFKA
ncbi:hypothetical protein [Tateyamaria sp.]|jgi:hypothetical protein|uniref:hypothetical protein n=1 Tax=Tateyamaria sp. TaxID=1929288 RepID=UPI003B21DC9C